MIKKLLNLIFIYLSIHLSIHLSIYRSIPGVRRLEERRGALAGAVRCRGRRLPRAPVLPPVFRVQGPGFRVQGSGFRVQGPRFIVAVIRCRGRRIPPPAPLLPPAKPERRKGFAQQTKHHTSYGRFFWTIWQSGGSGLLYKKRPYDL